MQKDRFAVHAMTRLTLAAALFAGLSAVSWAQAGPGAASSGLAMQQLMGAGQGDSNDVVFENHRPIYEDLYGAWAPGGPTEESPAIHHRIGEATFTYPKSATPGAVLDRATNTGCEGFWYCMGSALTSPILVTTQALLTGSHMGQEAIAKAGGGGPISSFLSLLGALPGIAAGAAAGAALAVVGVITGIGKAIASLWQD